jgi:xanthine dehydrogenase small subunit
MASHPSGTRWPRFLLDGEVVEARGVGPTTTLLQYLRGPLQRCGTKEGCAEGDCGACTVVVGERAAEGTRYRAINSCIRFVATLDGKEVVTVEGLRAPDGALHPVQQAMVDAHASQCGFCTPGFVMSLFALWLQQDTVDSAQAMHALSGNLCRCTGYRPIIEAATHMGKAPAPSHWSREEAFGAKKAAAIAALPQTPVNIPGFAAPRTLEDLATAYLANPEAQLLAGGTDVGLWVTKHLRDLPGILYLGDVAGLDAIGVAGGELEIGAAASLSDAYAAIVGRYPEIDEMAARFGSVPVRNSGTLCGNLGNGSPIGDSMPILIALGATVVLRRGERERTVALESIYRGYRDKTLEPGEFIRAVRVPLPVAGLRVATYKVSKRFDQDISAVCGAFAVMMQGERIATARVAYGGMAAIPKRAAAAEAALQGKPWAAATFEAAAAALERDFAPIDDMRASAEYRRKAAAALLLRFHLAHDPRQSGSALRVEDVLLERA